MVEAVHTVPTLALQAWFKDPTSALGWPPEDVGRCQRCTTPVMTGYHQRLNTWADFSHLVEAEDWQNVGPIRGHKPGSIAYFCGPHELVDCLNNPQWTHSDRVRDPQGFRDDVALPWRQHQRGLIVTKDWLCSHHLYQQPLGRMSLAARGLLAFVPAWLVARVAKHYQSDRILERLYAPLGSTPDAAFEFQYVRVNVNPSDLYVQSVAGSTKHRLAADDSGFDNLYLAGDWVLTELNAGCVEAAVMAGYDAARALDDRIPGDFLHRLAFLAGGLSAIGLDQLANPLLVPAPRRS